MEKQGDSIYAVGQLNNLMFRTTLMLYYKNNLFFFVKKRSQNSFDCLKPCCHHAIGYMSKLWDQGIFFGGGSIYFEVGEGYRHLQYKLPELTSYFKFQFSDL